MSAVRGLYSINPSTQGAGKWIEFSGLPNTYFGMAQASIDSITPANPTATTANQFASNLQSSIQNVITANHPQGPGALTASVIIKNVNPLVWRLILT